MKPAASIILSLACLFFLGGCAAPVAQEPATPAPVFTRTASPLETATGNFHWFRFSAFLYHGSKNVYFDPVSLSGDLPPADLILITHSHADSWSLSDIKKIVGPNTTLVVGTNAAPKYETFKDQIDAPAIILDEGESAEVDGIKITATHVKENPQHLPANGMVGFLVEIDGIRIYNASDTIFFPEMADIGCDIALYPIFNQADVALAVTALPAKVIIFERTSFSDAESTAAFYNGQGLPAQFVVPARGAYRP